MPATAKKQGGAIRPAQVRLAYVFASLIIVVGFGLLSARLYFLQVVDAARLAKLARDNTHRTFFQQAKRGDILDSRHNVLATSKPVVTVCADPSLIGGYHQEVAALVAPILNLPPNDLAESLRARHFVSRTESNELKTNELKYVVLKRRVDEETWVTLKGAMTNLFGNLDENAMKKADKLFLHRLRNRALFTEQDQIRIYPNNRLASHLLGYCGITKTNTPSGEMLLSMGHSGLEYSMNKLLSGTHGFLQTETDSRRREVVPFRQRLVDSQNGTHAVLTLDGRLQHIVETELHAAFAQHTPISVSCVVVRPKTGEILAMATLPDYDPNNPGGEEDSARRNRVIADEAEPGSTFKIVVVSAALNAGLVTLDTKIDCEGGRWFYAGKWLNDHGKYGILTVEEIITKSSNIGAAKIALLLGPDAMMESVKAFGFGDRTGIPVYGERYGTVVTPKSPTWTKLSISRIPMGHEILVTQLQMTMAMAAIANRGVLMRPLLVGSLVDDAGESVATVEPQVVRRVMSERAAADMVRALKTVVGPEGTASRAKLDYYSVAGKTGTAQKVVDGRYVRTRHYSSFIGFFPAENPEVCISVVFDEPKRGYYGGETAGPVFHRIGTQVGRYLAIPPDLDPEEEQKKPVRRTASAAND